MTNESLRDMMIERFITRLQTPIGANAAQYDKATLLKAVEVGVELERSIYDLCKGNEKPRREKFRSMLYVLTSHEHYKPKLLSGELSP